MAYSNAGFTLKTQGQVLIITASSQTLYTTTAVSSAVTLPATVSADTTYYVNLGGAGEAVITATITDARGVSLGVNDIPVSLNSLTIVAPLKTGSALSVGPDILGQAAIATTATTGFTYIATCAGTPSGTPVTVTGTIPVVFDTTNHKLYIFDGTWKGGTAPGAWS